MEIILLYIIFYANALLAEFRDKNECKRPLFIGV